jgi:hypothetical protein
MSKLQADLGFDLCFGIRVKVKFWCTKSYAGVEIWLHSFLISALSGVSGQPHVPADLPTEKYSPMSID